MGGGSQQPEIFTIPSKPAAGKRVEFVARAADPARTVRMEIWVGRQRVRTCNDDVCRFVGGPFKAGAQVCILSGPHKGRIVRVYSRWRGNTVRVELGGQAKELYRDIFSPTQLLRVNDDRQSTEENV